MITRQRPCGRPHSGEGLAKLNWMHVDRGREVRNLVFGWTSYMDDPIGAAGVEKMVGSRL